MPYDTFSECLLFIKKFIPFMAVFSYCGKTLYNLIFLLEWQDITIYHCIDIKDSVFFSQIDKVAYTMTQFAPDLCSYTPKTKLDH